MDIYTILFALSFYLLGSHAQSVYREDLVPSFPFEFASVQNHSYNCLEGQDLRGPYCYYITSTKLSWQLARQDCTSSYDFKLVEPSGVYDNLWLTSLAQANGISSFWIGMQANSTSYARWSDGVEASVVAGAEWGRNEPDFSQGDCVAITQDTQMGGYYWQIYDCTTLLPSICFARAFDSNLFRCEDGSKDIPQTWVCDGESDCDDFSDEENCRTCSEVQTGSQGRISSGYPVYPDKSHCTWSITGPPATLIHVQIESFDIENGLDLDVLNIYSGGSSEGQGTLLATLTGSSTDSSMYFSTNNEMFIEFITDYSLQGAGFNITWQAVTMAELCQETLVATALGLSGSPSLTEMNDAKSNLTSPFYPEKFVANLDCEWIIQASDPKSVVTVQLVELDIGSDVIRVRDGAGENSPVVAEYTGDTVDYLTPQTVTSSGNTLVIRFTSTTEKLQNGFHFLYWQGCDHIVLDQAYGIVQSPGYGNVNYPNNVNCSWFVEPDNVYFYFRQSDVFDVGDTMTQAGEDTLTTPVGVFDNDNLPGLTTMVPPVWSQMTLEFSTNAEGRRVGFRLFYDSVPSIPLAEDQYFSNYTWSPRTELGVAQLNYSCPPGSMAANEELLSLQTGTVLLTMQTGLYYFSGNEPNTDRYGVNDPLLNNRIYCQEMVCPIPPEVENAYIESLTGLTVGSMLNYSCYPAYLMQGSSLVLCMEDGWGPSPNCTTSGCLPIDNIAHRSSSLEYGDGERLGSVYIFTCDPGYQLDGVAKTLCKADGWEHPAPNCTEIFCEVPGVLNGRFAVSSSVIAFGTTVSLTCDPGFLVVNGTQNFTCSPDVEFDRNEELCEDVDECDTNNGGCNHTCIHDRGLPRCVCDTGYELAPDEATCVDVNECLENNGLGPCDQVCVNTLGSYLCDCNSTYTLYTADGTNGIFLRENATGFDRNDTLWLNHTCVPDPCPLVSSTLANGTVIIPRETRYPQYLLEGTVYFPGERVDYQCDLGFRLVGSDRVRTSMYCLADLTWSEPFPACEPAFCEYPNLERDQTYYPDVSGFTPVPYMGTSELVCSVGQPEPLILTRTCVFSIVSQTYRLEGDYGYCPVIDCGVPELVTGGNYSLPDSYLYGSNFTFQCAYLIVVDGSSKAGDDVVRCQQTGQWDFGSLTCLAATCEDPGTPGGGNQVATTYELGAEVTFGCNQAGYAPSDPYPLVCELNTADGSVKFNGTAPECVDVTAPTFPDCPTEVYYVPYLSTSMDSTFNPNHTIPVDNSGLVVSQTTEPPYFDPERFVFVSHLNVSFLATDGAGNTGACIIQVRLTDVEPPIVDCDSYIVYLDNDTHVLDVTPDPSWSNLNVLADDFDQPSDMTWTFLPASVQLGAASMPYGAIFDANITDTSGNTNICRFNVVAKPQPCSEYSAPVPQNGQKTCEEVSGVMTCSLTCDNNYYFSNGDASLNYTCTGEVWAPADYAPNCVARDEYATRYLDIFISYELPVSSSPDMDTCGPTSYVPAVEAELSAVSAQLTQLVNFKSPTKLLNISVLGYETNPQVLNLTLRMDIGPTSLTVTQYTDDIYGTIEPFFITSRTQLSAFVMTIISLPSDGLCEAVTGYFEELVWTPVCSSEMQTLVEDDYLSCVPCAPGSYYSSDSSQCEACGPDTYQNSSGQTSCIPCPPNQHTYISGGAHSLSQCYDWCDPAQNGLISTTGGEYPCSQCSRSYPTDVTTCSPCPSGTDIPWGPGLLFNDSSECKAVCASGRYGAGHVEPCTDLPEGYYGTGPPAQMCADNETSTSGSTSDTQCTPVCTVNSTCQNGGSCLGVNHYAVCQCPAGFDGLQCEIVVDPCGSDPCYNGAACNSVGTNYTCTCPAGYSGLRCEEDPDNCIGNDCLNGAGCQDGNGTFTCLCLSSGVFVGEKCNQTTDICEAEPCAANGQCVQLSQTRRECVCNSGYTGDRCQSKIRLCSSRPCLHGGTCSEVAGNYTCTCTEFYTGRQCQTRVSPCDSMDCGRGQCLDKYTYDMGQCLCPRYSTTSGCKSTQNGLDYQGQVNVTASGHVCQRWDQQTPNTHGVNDGEMVVGDLSDNENYCRQTTYHVRDVPSNRADGPWCFTLTSGVQWEYCAIPNCPGNDYVDPEPNTDCRMLARGWQYAGNVSVTRDDIPCQRWDSQTPHSHTRYSQWRNFPEYNRNMSYAENYCRYPDKKRMDGTVWCYTSWANKTRQRCDTDLCPVNSLSDSCTVGDYCDSSVCANGVCVSDPEVGYMCSCEEGWSGSNCATMVDFCQAGPCQNEATCNSLLGNYSCDCQPGWTGADCSVMILLCDTECPTDKSDSCVNFVNDYDCYCLEGWKGKNCSVAVDACDTEPCLNGGVCSSTGAGNFTCSCGPGWEGSLCDSLIDNCVPNPCNNSAVCVPLVNDYYCVCPEILFGKNCELGEEFSLCSLSPCFHGNCTELPGSRSLSCDCEPEWTGQLCETRKDLCLPHHNYCLNGGICSYSAFETLSCSCPPGFSGEICETEVSQCDQAISDGKCPSNGTCVEGEGDFCCQCPLGYVGPDCQKAQYTDFDLNFILPDKSSKAQLPSGLMFNYTDVWSVMFHIRFSYSGDTGTFLTVYTGPECNEADETKLVEFTDEGVTVYMENNDTYTLRYNFPINIDGEWHHLGFTYLGDVNRIVLWYDSTLQQATLSTSLERGLWGTVVLGAGFIGSISQVHVWDRQLDLTTDILPVDGSCSALPDTTGLLSLWGTFSTGVGVRKVYPARCEAVTAVTSDGTFSWWTVDTFEVNTQYVLAEIANVTLENCKEECQNQIISGGSCRSINFGVDSTSGATTCVLTSTVWEEMQLNGEVGGARRKKRDVGTVWTYLEVNANLAAVRVVPEVVFCPGDMTFTSESRRTFVTWTEPVFNNARLVQSNYVSGTAFTWGEYHVSYVAESASLAKAYCDFKVDVAYWDCSSTYPEGVDPASCFTSGLTAGCDISCGLTNQTTCLPSPLLLTCSPSGGWDQLYPPNSQVDGCTEYVLGISEIYGLFTYPITAQSTAVKQTMMQRAEQVFSDYEARFPSFCVTPGCPGLTLDIVYVDNVNATLEFTIQATMGLLQDVNNTESISAFDIVTRGLTVDLDFDFTPAASAPGDVSVPEATVEQSSAILTDTLTCSTGQELRNAQCVECCEGSYYNSTLGVCTACEIGYYQTQAGQTSCIQCPSGTSTEISGSQLASDCQAECPAGEFYNQTGCVPCDFGFYQPQSGQYYCEPCGVGETTQNTGSLNSSSCYDECSSGTQLSEGGLCLDCPRGFYRTVGIQQQCVACPLGYITPASRAVSQLECNLADCQAGEYRNTTLNICQPCMVGSYQPEKWQDECLACNDTLDTASTGSTNESQCLPACDPGYELQGFACVDCPIGYYKIMKLGVCQQCPLGYTTPNMASASLSNCSLAFCTAGTYRDSNNTCVACEIGSYQPQAGQVSCLQCGENYTTTVEAAVNSSECRLTCQSGFEESSLGVCTLCHVGFYRERSSQIFTPCAPCPPGNLTAGPGATDLSDCAYPDCPDGQGANDTECISCPRASYRDGNDTEAGPFCLDCPSGNTTLTLGATTIGECVDLCVLGEVYDVGLSRCSPCPVGTYQDQLYQTECEECPADTYNNQTGQASESGCLSCGANYNTNGTGATGLNQCLYVCPDGFEFNELTESCQSCAVGYYRNSTKDPIAKCTMCPFGLATVNINSTSIDDCTIAYCRPGSYLDENNQTCFRCPYGTYQPDELMDFCYNCSVGHGTQSIGADSAADCGGSCEVGYESLSAGNCSQCNIGYYKAGRGIDLCLPCPGNTTTLELGAINMTECTYEHCPSGQEDNGGVCVPCQQGYYRNRTLNFGPVCKPCSENMTVVTIGEGAVSPADCNIAACPAGEYYDSGTGSCESCVAGTWQDQQWQVMCKDCPKGTYSYLSGQVSLSTCILCDLNFTTISPGSNHSSLCLPECVPGSAYNTSTSSCELCPEGTYQELPYQYQCVACPPGNSTSGEGADSRTACQVSCPSGQELISEVCQPCQKGFYKEVESVLMCEPCPDNRYTESEGSTSVSYCNVLNCISGREYSAQVDNCITVPQGFYRNASDPNAGLYGTQCPSRLTTAGTGSTGLSDCNLAACLPGSYRNTGNVCDLCPVGTYQMYKWQDLCFPCQPGFTTTDTGNTNAFACYSTDECETGDNDCDENAACTNTPDSYMCECLEHYEGDGITCQHVCEVGYCKNGASCEIDSQSEEDAPLCTCTEGYTGADCNVRLEPNDSQTTIIITSVVGGVVGFVLFFFMIIRCLAATRAKNVSISKKRKSKQKKARKQVYIMPENTYTTLPAMAPELVPVEVPTMMLAPAPSQAIYSVDTTKPGVTFAPQPEVILAEDVNPTQPLFYDDMTPGAHPAQEFYYDENPPMAVNPTAIFYDESAPDIFAETFGQGTLAYRYAPNYDVLPGTIGGMTRSTVIRQ